MVWILMLVEMFFMMIAKGLLTDYLTNDCDKLLDIGRKLMI